MVSGMVYRDSNAQLLSKLAELQAFVDGFGPRIEALEATVERLEVAVVVMPRAGTASAPQSVADELRDKHVAEQVGHLLLRVAALEEQLGLKPPRESSDDDLRALVDSALGEANARSPRRR